MYRLIDAELTAMALANGSSDISARKYHCDAHTLLYSNSGRHVCHLVNKSFPDCSVARGMKILWDWKTPKGWTFHGMPLSKAMLVSGTPRSRIGPYWRRQTCYNCISGVHLPDSPTRMTCLCKNEGSVIHVSDNPRRDLFGMERINGETLRNTDHCIIFKRKQNE